MALKCRKVWRWSDGVGIAVRAIGISGCRGEGRRMGVGEGWGFCMDLNRGVGFGVTGERAVLLELARFEGQVCCVEYST